MDDWMNRFRAFAEAVVIMVCPVLLAIALKKVTLKTEEHGRAVLIIMLVVAAVSLTAGIFPYLICCISKRLSNDRSRLLLSVTRWLAPLSCACLIALACWIISLIIYDNWAYPAIGAVFGFCIVVRTVGYFCAENARKSDHATVSKLENSLEFLSGVTALLFLGLEGLALEGQIKNGQGIQHRLAAPMGSSFIACVLGVSLMLVETIPPLDNNTGCYGSIISNLTEIFDVLMALAVGVVMFLITYTLVKLQALLLLAPPFLILVVHVFDVAVNSGGGGGGSGSGNNSAGAGGDGATGVTSGSSNRGENPKPASLELTKVTFTGFLAVSVPSISSGSLNKCTDWFLVLAASAVVSGLVWRLLTHTKSAVTGNAPIYASFCAHLCVAIATVPFTLMAGNALS